MAKAKFNITRDGRSFEVEGIILNGQWGIDKREDGRYYLTHIPSGKLVWSSRAQMFLKRLVQEPAFLEPVDDTNLEQVNLLARAISRFCDQNGWK